MPPSTASGIILGGLNPPGGFPGPSRSLHPTPQTPRPPCRAPWIPSTKFAATCSGAWKPIIGPEASQDPWIPGVRASEHPEFTSKSRDNAGDEQRTPETIPSGDRGLRGAGRREEKKARSAELVTEIKKQARRGSRRGPSRPPSWSSRGSRWRQAAQKVAKAKAKLVSVSVERSPPRRRPSITFALTRPASPMTPDATFVRQSPRDDAGRRAADNRFGRIRAPISVMESSMGSRASLLLRRPRRLSSYQRQDPQLLPSHH